MHTIIISASIAPHSPLHPIHPCPQHVHTYVCCVGQLCNTKIAQMQRKLEHLLRSEQKVEESRKKRKDGFVEKVNCNFLHYNFIVCLVIT